MTFVPRHSIKVACVFYSRMKLSHEEKCFQQFAECISCGCPGV